MKRLIVVILILCTCSCMLYAYINVEPLYFDKEIDGQGGYKVYTLTNSTNKTLRYRVYSEKISEKNDMSQWMDFYPKSITLKSGESKKIKLLVIAPEGTEKGEYIANLGIKEIPIPLLKDTSAVSLYTNLQIELAGFVGNLHPKVNVKNLNITIKNKKLYLNGSIKNIGEIRTKVDLFLEDSNKNTIYLGGYRLFKGDKKLLNNLKSVDIGDKKIKNYSTFIVTDRKGTVILKDKIQVKKGN